MCPSCIAAKVARQQMIDEYVSKGMRFIVKGKRKSKPPQIFHAGVCNITRLCLYTKAEIILTIFMSTIINIQIHNHLSMDRIGSILIVQIIRQNTSAKLSNNAPNLLSAMSCSNAVGNVGQPCCNVENKEPQSEQGNKNQCNREQNPAPCQYVRQLLHCTTNKYSFYSNGLKSEAGCLHSGQI